VAIRALERYAILAANGGLVGGLAADGSTLYNSMAPLVAAPHLFHPMVTPLFSGLAKAQATVFNAPMRASMSKINAAFAAFEEARTGDAAYIASDVKSMGKHLQIVRALGAYGGLFCVVAADSTGAKNLAKAATSGVGFLSPDATYEECVLLVKRGTDALVSDRTLEEIDKALEEVEQEGTDKTSAQQAFMTYAEGFAQTTAEGHWSFVSG